VLCLTVISLYIYIDTGVGLESKNFSP